MAYDASYLTAVTDGQSGTSWSAMVAVDGTELSFKLDTGAEVTVISEDALKSLDGRELQSSSKRLCGPDNRPLAVLGELSATLTYCDRSCVHPVYVVRELQKNLLGLPAIQALNLLTPVAAIETSVPNQYPGLFTGLGTFPGSYKVQPVPGLIHRPRNLPW